MQNIYKIYYFEDYPKLYKIEIESSTIKEGDVIQFPAWRPGRYEIQNYFQYIKNLNFSIETKKVSKDSYLAKESGKVKISYEFIADIPDAGGSWKTENLCYINPINCLAYISGEETASSKLELYVPERFKLACGKTSFYNNECYNIEFDTYYELADTPLLASPDLQKVSYEIAGIPFHLWFWGNIKLDPNRLIQDFSSFTKEQLNIFGSFPFKEYHFLFLIWPYRHYHGVEHANSTVITLGPADNFSSEEMYEKLMGISCHELFHAWNALAIRPKELSPYDFSKERYFDTGYIIEGVTTYYGDWILSRSGVYDQAFFQKELNQTIKRHLLNEGRNSNSLANSSKELWLDGYKAGIEGRKVSIYNEGCLIAFALDYYIREETNDSKNLDHVMRLLWERYGEKGIGYSTNDYKEIIEEVIDTSMNDYFDECVFGKGQIMKWVERYISKSGFKLEIPEYGGNYNDFGFTTISQENKTIISFIRKGSHAEKYLIRGDEILNLKDFVENNKPLLISRNKVEYSIEL